MIKFLPLKAQVTLAQTTNPVVLGLLFLSVVTLLCTIPVVSQWLLFDAELVVAYQIWRPITGWLTQLNFQHWMLNQWGLVVMAFLLPKRLNLRDLSGYLWVWLVASIMLWQSEYSQYVGLSGLLYGWLVISAFLSPYYSFWVRTVFISVLSVKVLSENGWLPFSSTSNWVGEFIQAEVAVESHLWGLLAGLAFIAIRLIFRRSP